MQRIKEMLVISGDNGGSSSSGKFDIQRQVLHFRFQATHPPFTLELDRLAIYEHNSSHVMPYKCQADPEYYQIIGFRSFFTHATLFLPRLDCLIRLTTAPSFD